MRACLTLVLYLGLLAPGLQVNLHSADFVIQVYEDEVETARQLASDHGMRLLDTTLEDGHYHLVDHRLPRVSSRPAAIRTRNLAADPRVRWVRQQVLKHRELRRTDNEVACVSSPQQETNSTLLRLSAPRWTFNDPFFPKQWYLHGETRSVHADQAWEMGYTGRGVTAFILDDGVQLSNREIAANYEARGGADVSDMRQPLRDPLPRSDDDAHGTYCAAIIAGEADNGFCGIGVAFHAHVGGVKLLGHGPVSDLQEALALSLWQNFGDVASASWGPKDDGRSLDGPGSLASAALRRGVTKGRGGRGAVFVWAAGNGGQKGDNCNLDGYASSIYTLTVGALTQSGTACVYSEPCAAVLAGVYVGGPTGPDGEPASVVVPELDGGCRNTFQGTSAAAPLAAGIVALALQAAPGLTWREVQHAVVTSSQPEDELQSGWRVNAAGRRYHARQGFGAMHAGRLVLAAQDLALNPLPPHRQATFALNGAPIVLQPRGNTSVSLHVPENEVTSLEHVVATVSLRHVKRGRLELFLVSPAGTESQILTRRKRDNSTTGFRSWPFLSVHFWGEHPAGTWSLVTSNPSQKPGLLIMLQLHLYGH